MCRTRSTGVDFQEYTAPSPSSGSSSTSRQPDTEASSARRAQQTEGQPLLKVRALVDLHLARLSLLHGDSGRLCAALLTLWRSSFVAGR